MEERPWPAQGLKVSFCLGFLWSALAGVLPRLAFTQSSICCKAWETTAMWYPTQRSHQRPSQEGNRHSAEQHGHDIKHSYIQAYKSVAPRKGGTSLLTCLRAALYGA